MPFVLKDACFSERVVVSINNLYSLYIFSLIVVFSNFFFSFIYIKGVHF